MDYNFYNMNLEITRVCQENMIRRVMEYCLSLEKIYRQSIKENNTVPDKEGLFAMLCNRESCWEQKTYEQMKKWEQRHPITGIIICTILGGVFVSLVAEIVLEAIKTIM